MKPRIRVVPITKLVLDEKNANKGTFGQSFGEGQAVVHQLNFCGARVILFGVLSLATQFLFRAGIVRNLSERQT